MLNSGYIQYYPVWDNITFYKYAHDELVQSPGLPYLWWKHFIEDVYIVDLC